MADFADIRVSLNGRFVSLPTKDAVRSIVGRATLMGAQYAQAKWQEAATMGLDGIKPIRSRRYLRGIQAGLEYPYGDEFHARILNDFRLASILETGYPPFSMLPGFLRSPQARRNKRGEVFLIVPFRWGTPRTGDDEAGTGDQRATIRSMPRAIYDVAQRLEQSRMTSAYVSHPDDPNPFNRPAHPGMSNRRVQVFTGCRQQTGALRRDYQWGGRLKLEKLLDLQAIEHASLFQGMVRMQKGEGTHRGSHSHYLTFRIAHQRQLGTGAWQHPGQEPRPLSHHVAEKYSADVAELMQASVDSSLRSDQ